jgi:hypothetical protein
MHWSSSRASSVLIIKPQSRQTLGCDIPPTALALADEVSE